MTITISSLEDLPDAVEKFRSEVGESRKFALFGEMGVGKTTFINELMRQMEVNDHTSSPTFSIINEYFSVNYGLIYHLDFYRIENELEAVNLGIVEIFEANNYCFIEWPEKIANLLPKNFVNVIISKQDDCRYIEIQS